MRERGCYRLAVEEDAAERRTLRGAARLLRQRAQTGSCVYRFAWRRGCLRIRARWVWTGNCLRRQRWNKRLNSWV